MNRPILATTLIIFCLITTLGLGQRKKDFDLVKLFKEKKLEVVNRTATVADEQGKKCLKLTDAEPVGLVWIPGEFSNGTIEVDIKGRDVLQKSFVGIGFHAVNEQTMDAIYFRPFNFRSTDAVRKIHAVQYVSEPDFDWKRLREEHNGQYEKGIDPPPVATEWFHAKIVVHAPQVKVYVDGNSQPSLTIDKLNTRTSGKLALWMGTESDGCFANLSVTSE